MLFKNTTEQFSTIIKVLHWTIFVLFMTQFYLIWQRDGLPSSDPMSLEYILRHKSNGLLIFGLAVLMLIFRERGERPVLPFDMSRVEESLAKKAHLLLYFCMVFIPVTGYLMSTYGGYPVKFFGHTVPAIVGKNAEMAGYVRICHKYFNYLFWCVFSLHVLAAFKHALINRDSVFKRMLPFGKSDE